MAVTVGFSWIMTEFGQFSEGKLEGERPNTGFVYAPDAFSFVVAVLAGIAGTLSLTSRSPAPWWASPSPSPRSRRPRTPPSP